jgi:hypothetical protein
MTQQLSPAADAVLTAVTLTRYDVPPEGLPAFAEEMAPLLAAALRAAADQAAPEKQLEDIAYIHESYVDGMRDALACIEIIADELEAQ